MARKLFIAEITIRKDGRVVRVATLRGRSKAETIRNLDNAANVIAAERTAVDFADVLFRRATITGRHSNPTTRTTGVIEMGPALGAGLTWEIEVMTCKV